VIMSVYASRDLKRELIRGYFEPDGLELSILWPLLGKVCDDRALLADV
jgi:hypothetical protein